MSASPVALALLLVGPSAFAPQPSAGVRPVIDRPGTVRLHPALRARGLARVRAPPHLCAAAESEKGGSGGLAAQRQRRVPRLSVAIILAAAFLNLLGFTMLLGFTPVLATHFGLSMGARFGTLTSAYPLGMLFGVMIWPALSDRVGRKPTLTLSLAGSGIGLALQALAVSRRWSLSTFLALRVLTGSCAGA